MVFKLLRKLVGGDPAAPAPAPTEQEVEYNGYRIRPAPKQESSGWRVAGVISKDVDGETRTHEFVRADTLSNKDDSVKMSVAKAQRIVDEQGDRMFKTP